ncbi:TetR family transcriptional regulator [Nonomuraea longicatena]|uniref:TetR family transcriptional regulator n=1 Tax=Nonomuraea longicatena TaxID=83682 RepID=A0ABN1NWW7_9ACTN
MTPPAFHRARRPEHKQQRREAILAAARTLAVRSGVRAVTLGDVARTVGLAKSNVVRYFGTREAIYLELAGEEWQGWTHAAAARIGGGTDVATALAETLEARPLLCDLLGHITTTLEHNASVAAARTFKQAMHASYDELGERIVAARPELTPQEAAELILVASVMGHTLYAIGRPPATMLALYAMEPELAAASCFPFVPTLRRLLDALADGLPRRRATGPE